MATEPPTIDLTGYRRLHDLERRLDFSPPIIVCCLIGCAGLVLAFVGMFRPNEGASFGLPAAGFVMILLGIGGMKGYTSFRLARLECPRCGRDMVRHAAELAREELGPTSHEIEGRYYGHPTSEDDTRRWVRLVKEVRACKSCRSYVNCSPLEQSCTEEDWERIRRRFPNDDRDHLRQQAWGKAIGTVVGLVLIAGFFLIWWWSLPK